MGEIDLIAIELEQQRRSLAMLPPRTPLLREHALAIIERC